MITTPDKPNMLDLTALRGRLQQTGGKKYWRSLDELADTQEFQQLIEKEFSRFLPVHNPLKRRTFLKLMGASLALAGLHACTKQPPEKIFPYVQPPEELLPGKPLYFATAMLRGGYANGVLVENHMGRPTKVEGNPEHPGSLGATDIFAQAEVLNLYDPERSQVIMHLGRISTWEAFVTAMSNALEAQRAKAGAGLRIFTETITSPSLSQQILSLLATLPGAKWYQYEPVNRDQAYAGAQLAFREFVETHYRFDRAEVVLSLDADFMSDMPGSLRYAREFMAKRRVADAAKMNRLYVIESTPTLTGTIADHRLAMKPSFVEEFARALLAEIEDRGLQIEDRDPRSSILDPRWIKAIASDLKKHRGTSIVIAGEQQSPVVHAFAHVINHTLGNVGQTVAYTAPVTAHPALQTESLRELVAEMSNGSVDLLLMLGGNPAFNAPADLSFAQALTKVPQCVHLSLHEDETSALSHWHIPALHSLENWGDARAFDGTVTLMQPLIAPLYGGKSPHEIIALFTNQAGQTTHDMVQAYWRSQNRAGTFEDFWQTALHDGMIANTALPPKSVTLQVSNIQQLAAKIQQQSAAIQEHDSGLELVFRPDPSLHDGRYANNGWLQELPKPFTRLTWDNAALLSPALAERLGLKDEDVVDLRHEDRTLRTPVWIVPGHPAEVVTVHFGYGRERGGSIAKGAGVNAYALRTSDAPWHGVGVEIHKTGERYALASTQIHHNMENRHLVRAGTLEQFLQHPEFVHEMGHEPAEDMTLYPPHKYEGHAWGMVIDLNSCLGCSACTIACQSENNIPVVGKEQVENGREMHWIRVDRYYHGELDNPETYHQPVPCMHCENAPCEPVCPVGATVHSDEGLNDMVYNRCVGTRYCANNCPYKVRRFNFFLYQDFETPSLQLLRNPDVSVRSRGVMEKCTYCVQRINYARIEAKKEDRDIHDGEIVTACQQVCPTQAIAFGNINDPNSRVAQLRAKPLNYGLLADLNTRPRTTYLARLRNPNPELEEGVEHA